METSVYKINEPLENIYSSHKPRPIKVINTALSDTMKADEIASEIAKTEKVTAVVAVMSIFRRKRCKLQSANLGNKKPSCQKADFWRKIPADPETFLKN